MSNKRKRDPAQDEDQDDSAITQERRDRNPQTAVSNLPAKSKGQLKQEKSERRSKKQRKLKEQEKGQEPSSATDTASTAVDPNDAIPQESMPKTQVKKNNSQTQKDDGGKKSTTPTRFIVFVGNLPFETTSEQIKEHFSKISPTSVRHSTDKKTGKSKGFAFIEFDSYDKMKTCLKLYHHSMFDPNGKEKGTDATHVGRNDGGEPSSHRRDKKSKGRRINVELTAGGGGKSKDRKAKIKTKNEKLKEERERRRIKEKAEREKTSSNKEGPPETGANATAVASSEGKDDRGDIHPSRLSRVRH